MSDRLHHQLLQLEGKLLEHAEKMERAMVRSDVRDCNILKRLERIEHLERIMVELLRDILQELRREHPPVFPATSGLSIRPYPGGR